MKNIFFAFVLILAACGDMDTTGNAPVIRASAFIYDPTSPIAAIRGKFVYDPNAPVVRAQRFIIEK